MPSPFPGMNPYLEHHSVWHDFHESIVPVIREQLAARLAPQFIARIDDHVYIHELSADERRLVGWPDIGISSTEPKYESGGLATLQDPAQVQLLAIDVERISYVEIRDRDGWDVVAVIELLNPADKNPGADREQYIGKRGRFLQSPTHLVEIDLLRGGPRMPFEHAPPACDYCILISRWQQRPRAGFWPLKLREPLPTIPIPLTDKYPDATLDLQTALQRVYDGARYENYIYRNEPEPPLGDADRQWAQDVLAASRTNRA